MSAYSSRLRALLRGHLMFRSTEANAHEPNCYVRLDLSGTQAMFGSTRAMKYLMASVPYLSELVLQDCVLSDGALQALVASPTGRSLQRLDLGRASGLTQAAIVALESLHQLTHLHVWPGITGREMAAVQNLESVRWLDLSGCVHVGDSAVQTILHRSGLSLRKSAAMSLTALNLSQTKVSDKVYSIIAKSSSAHKLHALSMNRCIALLGSGIEVLVKSCSSLTMLTLAGEASASIKFNDAFFHALPVTLRRLNLYRGRGIIDGNWAALATRYGWLING
jgi:hypothetical protein